MKDTRELLKDIIGAKVVASITPSSHIYFGAKIIFETSDGRQIKLVVNDPFAFTISEV